MAYIKTNLIDVISKNKKTKIITRFIGTSKDSYNIQNILSSIIEELSIEFHLEIDKIQISIDKIYDYFKSFIIKTALENKEIMFYFVLDSLDQLEKENDARKLGWLPVEDLPSNIRFILSTLSEDEYEAFPILFALFVSRKNFIRVSDFKSEDVQNLIDTVWYSNDNLKMKEKIQLYLKSYFHQNKKHCLYVKLIIDESFKWTEFTNFNYIVLAATTEIAIKYFFESIEKKIEKKFIGTALRYLTLSRKGIYYENWIKLLKREFKNPDFALLQLISELKQYLLGPLFKWYHSKFIQVAKEHYCGDTENECSLSHRMIVGEFYKENFIKSDLFWINELPYHAIFSKDVEFVKDKFLLNIKFMKTKIDLVGIDDLINDYSLAKSVFNDVSFSIIYSCLIASSSNLRVDSSNLTHQLIGRIPSNYLDLTSFVEKCTLFSEKAVIPNKKYLSLNMYESVENVILHNKQIVYVAQAHNKHLIINTIDKLIKLFSIDDLKIERSRFQRTFRNTIKLLISNDDNICYAIAAEKDQNNEECEKEGLIEAFNLVTKKKIFSIKDLDNENVENYGFALLSNYIFALTCNAYYKIDKYNGNILEKSYLSSKFSDDSIVICFQNDLISASFFGSSKLLFSESDCNLFSFDFNDYYLKGSSIFLPNSNVLLPMSKDLSPKSKKKNTVLNSWALIEFNILSRKVVKETRINKALILFGVSQDGNVVYGCCYSHIYGLDLNKQVLLYALEHYASIRYKSFLMLNGKEIISSSRSNFLCFYNVEKYDCNEDLNPFNALNSRNIKFIVDDFSIRCPLILVYNVFEKYENEIYLFYDLKNEKIIKKLYIDTKWDDFVPLCLISKYAVFVESLKLNSYCLISIRDFQIVSQIEFSSNRVFKRISFDKFVISHKKENIENLSLFELKCNSDKIDFILINDIVTDWESIEWHSINKVNLVYKIKYSDEISLYNFCLKQTKQLKKKLISFIQQDNSFSSSDGKYLVFHYSNSHLSKIVVCDLQNDCIRHQIFISKKIETIYFADCLLVVLAACDSEETLSLYIINPDKCIKNLKNCLFFSHKKNKSNYQKNVYKVVKHAASNYIWVQSLIYSLENLKFSELVVYDMNCPPNAVFNIDTEFKLKMNEIKLIGNGNYLLTKELDKIKFVIIYLKDNNMCVSNPQKHLFDEIEIM